MGRAVNGPVPPAPHLIGNSPPVATAPQCPPPLHPPQSKLLQLGPKQGHLALHRLQGALPYLATHTLVLLLLRAAVGGRGGVKEGRAHASLRAVAGGQRGGARTNTLVLLLHVAVMGDRKGEGKWGWRMRLSEQCVCVCGGGAWEGNAHADTLMITRCAPLSALLLAAGTGGGTHAERRGTHAERSGWQRSAHVRTVQSDGSEPVAARMYTCSGMFWHVLDRMCMLQSSPGTRRARARGADVMGDAWTLTQEEGCCATQLEAWAMHTLTLAWAEWCRPLMPTPRRISESRRDLLSERLRD